MPLMNCWEFIEELERRQSEIELEPFAILMYSSSDGKYDRDKARNYKSVANYIVKGDLTPENLQNVILKAHQ